MNILQPGLNKYIIHWEMSTVCNYKCEYCYNRKKEKIAVKNSDEILKNAFLIRKIIDFNSDKKIKLRLIGGEPSVWDLDKILDILVAENLSEVSISTNISKPVEYYENLGRKYPLVTFACSYHDGPLGESIQKDVFVNKINSLVDTLGESKVKARFVLTRYNQSLYEYIDSRLSIPLDPLALQGEYEYYSDVSKLALMSKGLKMLVVDGQKMSRYELFGKLQSVKGFRCRTYRLTIRQGGEMFMGNCEKPTYLSKLGENPIKLVPFEKICDYDKLCSLHAAAELTNEY